jgi:L-lactate dehydrogenase complex protein LldG
MSSAKDEILARVRGSLRDVPAAETSDDVAVARGYRRGGSLSREDTVALFAEHCADYRANVRRVTPAGLATAIREALQARDATRLAIPRDLPQAWRVQPAATADASPAAASAAPTPAIDWVPDEDLTHEQLSAVDGVVTGCAVAIAINGTIVLDAGAAQGRRALTLLPDHHLCIVLAEQVVELVPEGIGRLAGAAAAGQPMTMIAGPSATSDIELNRVEGVHGPRTLDVLVVG